MRSADKFAVKIGPIGLPGFPEKDWVTVVFNTARQSWIPSFEDLCRIVRAIGECEERKYPQERGCRGRMMVADFVTACLADSDAPWETLRKRFQIPERE